MANKKKRLAQEAEHRKNQKRLDKALRRSRKHLNTPRILRRNPEKAVILSEFKSAFNRTLARSQGRLSPRLFEKMLGSRPLIRALAQEPKYFELLLDIYLQLSPCRPMEDWKPPRSARPDRIMESFLRHTFVRYQMSRAVMVFLINVQSYSYETYRSQGIEQFIYIAKGGNLRKSNFLPFKITKKEAHHMLHVPAYIWFGWAAHWAVLFQAGFTAGEAWRLLQYNPAMIRMFEEQYRDVLTFVKNNHKLGTKALLEIVQFYMDQQSDKVHVYHEDWGSASIEPLFKGWNFKGATPESVKKRMDQWKEYYLDYLKAQKKSRLPVADVDGFELFQNEVFYEIKQLKSATELVKEGRAMSHCVGSYVNNTLKMQTTIWSLRLMGQRLATIELYDEKRVVQVKARFNEKPPDEQLEIVRRWTRKENLEYTSW